MLRRPVQTEVTAAQGRDNGPSVCRLMERPAERRLVRVVGSATVTSVHADAPVQTTGTEPSLQTADGPPGPTGCDWGTGAGSRQWHRPPRPTPRQSTYHQQIRDGGWIYHRKMGQICPCPPPGIHRNHQIILFESLRVSFTFSLAVSTAGSWAGQKLACTE